MGMEAHTWNQCHLWDSGPGLEAQESIRAQGWRVELQDKPGNLNQGRVNLGTRHVSNSCAGKYGQRAPIASPSRAEKEEEAYGGPVRDPQMWWHWRRP